MIDIHDGASVRNLERIQENGPRGGATGRGVTYGLIVVSGACILFAALAFGTRKTTSGATKKGDPLADLVSKPTSPTVLPGEVTFPGILSDDPNPATALAATGGGATTAIPDPPAPGDRLSVVPLPARHSLGGGSAMNKPKDKLSALADGAIDPAASGAKLTAQGSEGGWQVQVSSFRTEIEAEGFATQLRARGHRAHVQRAEIDGRGTWYRVKIGPFATQNEATRYRTAFEAKEKMPGFVIKSGTEPRPSGLKE